MYVLIKNLVKSEKIKNELRKYKGINNELK